MKNLIIASTSTLHGGGYLDYILPELKMHFGHCKTVLFIPFARPSGISHEAYTMKVADAFSKISIQDHDRFGRSRKKRNTLFGH